MGTNRRDDAARTQRFSAWCRCTFILLGRNVENYNLRRSFMWSYLFSVGSCGDGVNLERRAAQPNKSLDRSHGKRVSHQA